MTPIIVSIAIAVLQYGAPFIMDLANFVTTHKRLPTDAELSNLLLSLPPPGT